MNLKKIIQQLYYFLLILTFPIEILAQQNKITSEKRWADNLAVIINTKELKQWISNDAR